MDGNDLTKKAYDLHGIKYYLYEENNKFNGTPIPEGYEVIYIKDPEGFIPDSLKIKKVQVNDGMD